MCNRGKCEEGENKWCFIYIYIYLNSLIFLYMICNMYCRFLMYVFFFAVSGGQCNVCINFSTFDEQKIGFSFFMMPYFHSALVNSPDARQAMYAMLTTVIVHNVRSYRIVFILHQTRNEILRNCFFIKFELNLPLSLSFKSSNNI